MAIQSNYLEAAVADAILSRSTTIPSPGTLYFALFLAMPDDNGLNGAEVPSANGTGYSRKAVANTADEFPATPTRNNGLGIKGVKQNVSKDSGSITFPPALTDWGDVVGFGIYDAATGGNLLVSSTLDTPRTVARNDTMRFVDGELQFTEFPSSPQATDNILSFFMQRVVLDSLFGRTASYSTQTVGDLYFALFTKMPQHDECASYVAVPCTTTAGGTTLTMASTAGIVPGMTVSDKGETSLGGDGTLRAVADGTIVKSVDSSTTITLSAGASAASPTGGVVLVFANGQTRFDSGVEVGGNCTLPCSTTRSSTTIHVADHSVLSTGMNVSGGSVPGNAKITSMVDGKSGVVLNYAPTADSGPVRLTFVNNGTGYTRVSLANNATNFPPYANGLKTNATQVVWPVCQTSWDGVVGLGIYDAATGGNLLFKIPFAATRNFVAGEQPRLASNALSIYLD